jgi:Flp pilus assembly pilin Flp
MQSWYKVDLPLSECCRNRKADQLQKAFEEMFIISQRPRDVALFEWHEERLQTNVFYFTPAAARLMKTLIEHFQAVECALPVLADRLVLIVGHAGARQALESRTAPLRSLLDRLCRGTDGQDVAEYAIMLAVILVIVMGVVRMIGSNASTVFSQVASTIQ